MVTNLDYLLASTHDPGANVVFAKTHGDAAAVARRVAEVARPAGASVKDITTQTAQTVSSITTVDLSGISKIEEAFTVLLAAAAMWLFVSLVVAERRGLFQLSELPAISHDSVGATDTSRSATITAAYIRIISERRSSTSPSGTNSSNPSAYPTWVAPETNITRPAGAP